MSLSDDFRTDEERRRDIENNLAQILALMPIALSSSDPQMRSDISETYLVARKLAEMEKVNATKYDLIALSIATIANKYRKQSGS